MNKVIKALFLDLDGTAIPSRMDGMPTERLTQAIASKPSTQFCAATGRSWSHARDPIQALSLTAPCVISGGAQIVDPVEMRILWHVMIAPASVKAIQGLAKQYDKKLAYVTGLTVTDAVHDSYDASDLDVNTIYMFNIEPNELQTILEVIHREGNLSAALTRSWMREGVVDLHITHMHATKEHAITQALVLMKIKKKYTAGVGDGLNDLHLFNAVSHKVAMGNAENELKKAADIVIGSIDEDGLAKFIESFKAGVSWNT